MIDAPTGLTSTAGSRRRGAVVRRVARWLGALLGVVGVLAIAWTLTVWLWQDPFTAAYAHVQQHRLAASYARVVKRYVPPPAPKGVTPAQEQRLIGAAARRYRLRVGEGEAIGRIRVPALGLNMVLVDGTDHDSLKKGPGLDRRTYMPGQHQLVYIAGHRTTYLAPFAHIDRLKKGDRVTLELPYATFVYSVIGHKIVPATDLSQLVSHGREVVALQACHPRFFASHRYIAYAVPVRVIPRRGPTYVPA
jgi:sortase A